MSRKSVFNLERTGSFADDGSPEQIKSVESCSSSSCASLNHSESSTSSSSLSSSRSSSTQASSLENSASTLDLEIDTSRGIPLETFLVLAFNLTNETFTELSDRALEQVADARHHDELNHFASRSISQTDPLCEAFAMLGNSHLDKVMSDTPQERRVRFLAINNPHYEDKYGTRCPDICLVPENVSKTSLRVGTPFNWRRVFTTTEVRPADRNHTTKRAHESDDDCGPPQKRARSPVSKDIASSIPTADPGSIGSTNSSASQTKDSPCDQSTHSGVDNVLSRSSKKLCKHRSTSSRCSQPALSSNGILCESSTEWKLAAHNAHMLSFGGDQTFSFVSMAR